MVELRGGFVFEKVAPPFRFPIGPVRVGHQFAVHQRERVVRAAGVQAGATTGGICAGGRLCNPANGCPSCDHSTGFDWVVIDFNPAIETPVVEEGTREVLATQEGQQQEEVKEEDVKEESQPVPTLETTADASADGTTPPPAPAAAKHYTPRTGLHRHHNII